MVQMVTPREVQITERLRIPKYESTKTTTPHERNLLLQRRNILLPGKKTNIRVDGQVSHYLKKKSVHHGHICISLNLIQIMMTVNSRTKVGRDKAFNFCSFLWVPYWIFTLLD